MKSVKNILALLCLASCSHNPALSGTKSKPLAPENNIFLEEKVRVALNSKDISLMEVKIDDCPKGMANIDNQYCIDQYEASIIDKTTGEFASPHYIPSQEDFHDADWQYNLFKNKAIPKNQLAQLIRENQPLAIPLRGAEQFPDFKPAAISQPNKIPASYVNKIIAEQSCTNAGKRLCTRKEWYKACTGPDGPLPYLNKKGEQVFPETYPYGSNYLAGKCNVGLHTDRWPPGLLGRKNNDEMLDPRIGTLLGADRLPMKRETDSFPECINEYGVYNLLGNIHEMVSDTREEKTFIKEKITYVGSHYARSASESCAEATIDHWKYYADYSLGFRCCKDIK
ncbi:MAG: hypothetical protein AABX24_05125 [Nanoarchaeota archaeon]